MIARVTLSALHILAFIRWRSARTRGSATAVTVAGTNLDALVALNDAEVAIVLLIPFVAALMARGAWLY